MIRAVRANQKGFHTALFQPGVNLILADRSISAGDKDTTNALGKSTLIEIIDFCLASNTSPGKGLRIEALQGCLNHHRRGTCGNNRTIMRGKLEERVLSGLKNCLVSAESVAEAVRAYAEQINRLNRERRAHAETDRKALAKVESAIAGIISAIEDGMYQPSMKARMDDLERQKAEITARLAEAPASVPDVHPGIANIYRARVASFIEALDDPNGGRSAAEALRSLIGEVILSPGGKRGEVHAELRGELMAILDFANPGQDRRPGQIMTGVEASPRNHLYLR